MSAKKGNNHQEQLPLKFAELSGAGQGEGKAERHELARIETIDSARKRRDRSVLISQLDKSGVFR
jgi:ribosomal protein L29